MKSRFVAVPAGSERSENRNILNYWAEKGKQLIDENYPRLHGVEDVCHSLGISASYFRDVFQTAFAMSPRDYLAGVKIERAKTILLERSVTVSEVSVMVGFGQRSVFTKAFKRITGMSPAQFRGLSSKVDFGT